MWNQLDSLSEEVVFNNTFIIKSVFRISNSGATTGELNLTAHHSNRQCAIAVDGTLCIFDKEKFADGKSLTFDATVDCFAIGESIVVCALSNGCIYGIHTSGAPLFQVSIEDVDVTDDYCFVDVIEHNAEFYFCCKNGKIYKTLNIDIEKLRSAEQTNAENTLNMNETLNQDVQLVILNDTKCSSFISAYSIVPCAGSALHILGSASHVHWFNEGSHKLGKLAVAELRGVKRIQGNDEVCFLLAGNGSIYELCPHTKILDRIQVPDGWTIKDFNMQETNDNGVDLLILAVDTTKQLHTKVLDYKSLQTKWSLRVEEKSSLVMQHKSSVSLYYLCPKSSRNNDIIDRVELKVVSEYQPEARMLTLLGRGLIAEAEQIADQFKLNKMPIHEAKAKHILASIIACDPQQVDEIQGLFNDLTEVAKVMENRDYLLQLRTIQVSQRSIMRRYAELLMQFLNADKYKAILVEIGQQLQRLNTLDLFDPNECFMKWREFVQKPNLVSFLFTALNTDIPVACLILSRHSANILDSLKGEEKGCTKILAQISNDAEPMQIIQWIQTFYPMATERFPAMAPIIINWVVEKTVSYEGADQWPLIGIEFGREMQRIFDGTRHTFADVRRQASTAKMLGPVIFALEELQVLKTDYNLRMPFADYFGSSIENRAMHLLRRTNLRNLRKLVEQFIFVVCREHGEEPQAILFAYIQQVIGSRKANAAWLERAIACMQLLCNVDKKLQTALEIARAAPVPWSDAMRPIIGLMHSPHRLAQAIKAEYHRMDFKMLQVKYEYRTDNPNVDYLKLLQCCIKNNAEPIDEIRLIKKQAPGNVFRLNMMAMLQLTTRGRVDTAIALLNALPKPEHAKMLHHIAASFTNMIDEYIGEPPIYDDIMEMLKYVVNKDARSEYKAHVHQLEDLHRLRQSDLRISITMSELDGSSSDAEPFVRHGIDRILDELKRAKVGLVGRIFNYTQLVARALRLDELVVVLRLARTVNDVHFTSLLAKLYHDNRAKDDGLYIEMARLLMVQQYAASADTSTIKLSDNVSYAYPMAQRYLAKVRLSDDPADLFSFVGIAANEFDSEKVAAYRADDGLTADTDAMIMELLGKLSAVKQEIVSQRRDSFSIFDTNPVQAKASNAKVVDNKIDAIVRCLNDALYVIVHVLKPNTFVYEAFKAAIPPIAAFDRNAVITALDALLKMKLFSPVFSILAFYRQQQTTAESKFIGKSSFQLLLRKLLKVALQQKEPRADLLAIYLRSEPNAMEALDSLKQELSVGVPRVNCLLLCERFGQLTRNADLMHASKDARVKYDYYLQLRHIDPALKDTFQITDAAHLFDSLNKKMLDVGLLQRMAADLQWNVQEVLVQQIVTILKQYELRYEVVVDATLGDEQLKITTATEPIQSLCAPYLKHISDKKLLTANIKHFMNTIDPYFYEMYLSALHVLNDIGTLDALAALKQWINILVFLKANMVTKRTRRIGPLEDDWWIKQYNDTIMPDIAKYRLPFPVLLDSTIDFREIVGEVVTLYNCVDWFPLVQMLAALNGLADTDTVQDSLCIQAAKETISERKSNTSATGVWNLQPLNNEFLQAILDMVRHIKGKDRILVLLYMVYCQSPDGADQLEAIEECYKFAVAHEQMLRAKPQASDLVDKIFYKHPIIKAQHKLHLYGLYGDDLSSYISNPVEFIKALYNRPNVMSAHDKLDLNQVAEDFADLFGLDIHPIQLSLLNSWFAVKGGGDEANALEQTFCDTDLNSTVIQLNENSGEIGEDVVEKAYYILKSWNVDDAHTHLIERMSCTEGGSLLQMQLYDCLIKLIDKKSIDQFKKLITEEKYVALKCVHYLQPLGFNLTIEKFHAYDKITILKQIWSSSATNPKALDVMRFICIGYNIYEPKLWNGILRQMVQLHMDAELAAVVRQLATQEQIVQNADGLVVAYEYLIQLAFKSVTKVRSAEQAERMADALQLAQSCPVQHKLNLVDLSMMCIGAEQSHIAAIFMVLSNEANRMKLLKVLKPLANEKLRKDIIGLEELGIYPFTSNRALSLLRL